MSACINLYLCELKPDMMNFKLYISLLFLFLAIAVKGNIQKTGFDKSAFYSAMASNNMEAVNIQLDVIKASFVNEKEAYEGALMMKKAGLVTKAKEKLSLFKAGRLKLEAAIKKDKDNTEYSFLRLIIQEHAPKIIDYSNNIKNDIAAIRSNFNTLPQVVQQAISDYSKKSKVLKPL
jgi:translation initiation factor 2B subunit (eIF-2B alpha/beta/delta family)